MRLFVATALGVMLLAGSVAPQAARPATPAREAHMLWVHPPDAGRDAASMKGFLDRCQRAHIDTLLLLVKGMAGEIYWNSRRFPQAIAPGWQSWDILKELTTAAHARGIEVHAWLVDFAEGETGAAYREHPEWAQLNPDGSTTASETLGVDKRHYPYVWMCPARRPGYQDQWLLPMIEEIVANYQVDGIHHDYVRYPGDVAPDSYCFDDYCLAHLPKWALLRYEARASERYRVMPVQERIDANWWSDPTMLPADWDQLDRREKADFLLNGRTIPLGAPDMRSLYYAYRVEQITRFVRDVHDLVKRRNPRLAVSASVFKNPILSGRFIGQRWDEWTPWIDFYTPMTYRSHFAGTFEAYLDHLRETTTRQIEWTRNERSIDAGIATTYLYREEYQPVTDVTTAIGELTRVTDKDDAGGTAARSALQKAADALEPRLRSAAPQRSAEIKALVGGLAAASPGAETTAAAAELTKALNALRASPPEGWLPPEKLTRAIQAARDAHPAGVAIFSAGSLTREHLWPALEAAFAR